ncbi:hypothetical protein [Prescottella agglutinans]|uniref:hypothetical protein n=1 Tax=Prescottella agglutinans TaxID=1644129 RepID=UPI003D97F8B9
MAEGQRRQRRPRSAKTLVLTLSWLTCIAVVVFVPGTFALMAGFNIAAAAAITGFTLVCVLVAALLLNLR